MNRRHFLYSLPMILLLIVIFAGWLATDYLGEKARQEIIGKNQASLLSVSAHLSSTLANIEGAVRSLAGSPWITPVLPSKKDGDIDHANSVLDRYNSALNASVSYLMDTEGMTVASSNRRDPDSFVGKSYRFRPYFQEAVRGLTGRYFALGVTSGKRGLYASHPVKDRQGRVLGAVAMKKDLDEMESFLKKYPFCFLVNPDGVIFLSSSPAMVLKPLWPIDKEVRDKLIASRQFGSDLSETFFLKKEITGDMETALEGKDYIASRRVVGSDGWSIVLLAPTDHIRIYRLTGTLATISACLLIMILSGIIYSTGRAREAIQQSEENKRLLLDAAGEGIFGVDTAGQVTFVNPAALRMLGFAEGEMLGQNAHGLIHHSREDGSYYPVEDCPMYASYARTTDSHTADEVLWRKDGSSFHVEYSSMPITRDGKVMGAVVTFKDITTRKEIERTLSESEEKFRKISMSARDAIIMMDSCGIITYWNEAAGRIFDYTPEEAVGKELHALLVPQRYYQSHMKGLGHFVKTGEGNAIGKTLELVAIRKNGAEFPIELSLSAVYLQDGWSAIGILRDITERKEAEETLQKSEQKFRALFEDSRDALYITTQQGRFIDFNQAYLELFGYTKEDMLALYAKDTYVNPDDRLTFVKMMEERGSVKDYEIKLRKKGGAGMECLMTATVKYADDGSILGYQGMIRDITELKHMEQQLHAMSLTDELTGLYNRRGFITLSEQQMKIAARTKKSMLLFFADLDRMKEINDTFGHKEGDKALISTAEVLRGVFRESDIIGRMGGDEFAILAIDTVDGTGEVLINRLRNTIDGRNRLEGMNYTLSLSTGVARYDPENPCSIDELMARADTLMYEEKRSKHH